MDERTETRLRGIRITAQEIIDDLARGDYTTAKQHAELIRDGVGGMLPVAENYEQQFCQCTITGRTEGGTQCSKCGKNLF